MSDINILQKGITEMEVDAIVNAANEGLQAGSGVCGAIFSAAGHDALQDACDEIGHCETGDAVVTPGFDLPAKYVIHAVGPRWHGGTEGEAELLASCYVCSLECAHELGCHSIAFPLISSDIFGYPKEEAWDIALRTCAEWQDAHSGYPLEITFCVISPESLALGQERLARKPG